MLYEVITHLLEFQLAHAKAQDAVHTALDVTDLYESLKTQTWSHPGGPICLHSRAEDRTQYLQRPDYGRLLDDRSSKTLKEYRTQTDDHYDLTIAIVDGLSALAIEMNA